MQHSAAAQIPKALAEPLWRFVLKRRQMAFLRALALALLLVSLWLLSWAVVDRFVPLPVWVRLGLLVVLCGLIYRVMREPLHAIVRGEVDWRGAAWQFEQHSPGLGEALATVVSESLAADGTRGSAQITSYLAAQVTARLAHIRPRQQAESRNVIRAWLLAGIGAAFMIGLAFWPWLNLPHLLRRQVIPWEGTSAVTRSSVRLDPGAVEVLHGKELTIFAQVRNPGPEGVILRTSSDGQIWNSTAMALREDGKYTRTLTALSRDAQYEVRTGDAVSGPYPIRVLHQPIVRDLRVRLEYPPYVDREPLTVNYGMEPIEAPAGTKARVIARASEPLRSAWFTVNGVRAESSPSEDPNVRQTDITIDRDITLNLQMVSTRGVWGDGPQDVMIRAIPDRPPVARLLVPPGFTLVEPGGTLQIPYEANDDYAISALRGRVEVDGVLLGEIPLTASGQPHRWEGVLTLRLAEWNANAGQSVNVSLIATDRAGQTTPSPAIRLLMFSEPVLPEQRQRIAELKEAARLATGITGELESVRRELEVAVPTPIDARHATARLALAAERSSRLSRLLLMISAGGRPETQAGFYSSLIDSARVQSVLLEDANAASSVEQIERTRERIGDLIPVSEPLRFAIEAMWHGECARVILIERRALAGMAGSGQSDLEALRSAIEAETIEIGLEPRQENVQVQLQARVDGLARVMESYPRLDLLATVEQWTRRQGSRITLLPDRLTAAGQVEAVRPDADVLWVRDLHLASRAVRAIDAAEPPDAGGAASARGGLHAAFALLFREHEARRAAASSFPNDTQSTRAALQFIAGWAGEPMLAGAGTSTTRSQGNSAFAQSSGPFPSVSETRDQGIAAIRRALEILTEMPQLFYDIDQASRALRAARQRLGEAATEAGAAPPDEQAAAENAVAAAQEIVSENIDLLIDAAQPIDFTQPLAMSTQLRRYLPDTASALMSVEGPFATAMGGLSNAIYTHDPDAIERSIVETRRAIATAQQALRDSQANLRSRDPTIAARTFAATSRPSSQPASLLDPLRRPWDDPIRRLIEPQVDSRLSVPLNDQIATPSSGSPRPPTTLPAALPLWRNDDPSILLRDDDPPQYRDALNVYFQVLGGPADGVP